MTYATRLLTRKQTQGNDKRKSKKSSRISSKREHTQYKNNTSNKSRSLRSDINDSLHCNKKREDIGFRKVMVADILAIRSNEDEEYALLAYKDWQPVRNLRNATALIEKFWQNQASRTCQLVNATDSSSNIVNAVVDDNLKVVQANND
ncbi:3674_t:CDS:2, partial [Racocetra fulgida]